MPIWRMASISSQAPSAMSPLTASHGVPSSSAVLLDVGAALGGQRVGLATLAGLLDQPLVLELLEGGVDRAGARAPDAVGALLDLLHQAVAVAGLLGEQEEQGGADVAAACAGTARRAEAREAERRPTVTVALAASRSATPAGHTEPAERARIERGGMMGMHRFLQSVVVYAMHQRYIGIVDSSTPVMGSPGR